MKQTAVEWLYDRFLFAGYAVNSEWKEQAKEMEKEQMIDFAFKYGDLTTREIESSFDKEYKTNEK
jgi:hypothetical protein